MKFIIYLFLIFAFPSIHAADIPPLVMVVLGDSLTEGYGLTKEQAYPALLQQELRPQFPQLRVINAGISGSTSASAESRFKWQLKNKPQVLLLALGANDGLRGLSTDALSTHLEKTIVLAKSQNVAVILAGMRMPLNYGTEYTQKYEAVFANLAKRHHLEFIPFLLDGVATKKELNQPDGIHPTAEGYKIIAQKIAPTVSRVLKKVMQP